MKANYDHAGLDLPQSEALTVVTALAAAAVTAAHEGKVGSKVTIAMLDGDEIIRRFTLAEGTMSITPVHECIALLNAENGVLTVRVHPHHAQRELPDRLFRRVDDVCWWMVGNPRLCVIRIEVVHGHVVSVCQSEKRSRKPIKSTLPISPGRIRESLGRIKDRLQQSIANWYPQGIR